METKNDMVIDAAVANEGDGWRGSGANPWHLDNETESIVFLTDASDQPARMGFFVTANGIQYFLTELKLSPHETRAIDLRKLRDAQQPDFKKNLIPAGAEDGSVTWIRLDNVAVSGRLVVMQRHKRLSSSYDCCFGRCPPSYAALTASPATYNLVPGSLGSYAATATYQDVNGTNSYYTVTPSSTWSSNNTPVATVNSSGTATGVSGGTATIGALYTDNIWYFNTYYGICFSTPVQHGGSGSANVCDFTIAPSTTIYSTDCTGVTKQPQNFQATVSPGMTVCSYSGSRSTCAQPTITGNISIGVDSFCDTRVSPTQTVYYYSGPNLGDGTAGTITVGFTLQLGIKSVFHSQTVTVKCP